MVKKIKYCAIILIALLCIGCTQNDTISLVEGKYQCTKNGEENTLLLYEIDVVEDKKEYDFTLSMCERGMDLTISQGFSGSHISVSKEDITSKKLQIETTSEIGTPSTYTHEFQFKNENIYWKFVLNDENTDTKKEFAKKEYVVLKYVD